MTQTRDQRIAANHTEKFMDAIEVHDEIARYLPQSAIPRLREFVYAAVAAALQDSTPVAAPAWQPIETAPKDGSHIVVTALGGQAFGFCGGKTQDATAIVHWWDNPGEEGWYLSLGNDDSEITWPTHWCSIESIARRDSGPQYPRPCGLCPSMIESDADLEWHGLGNCVSICERCTGSGIDPSADASQYVLPAARRDSATAAPAPQAPEPPQPELRELFTTGTVLPPQPQEVVGQVSPTDGSVKANTPSAESRLQERGISPTAPSPARQQEAPARRFSERRLGAFRKALSEAGLHGHYNLFQKFFCEDAEWEHDTDLTEIRNGQ